MAGHSADEFVHVAAHVLGGLLAELEIFAGDGIRTATPAAGDIHSWTSSNSLLQVESA